MATPHLILSTCICMYLCRHCSIAYADWLAGWLPYNKSIPYSSSNRVLPGQRKCLVSKKKRKKKPRPLVAICMHCIVLHVGSWRPSKGKGVPVSDGRELSPFSLTHIKRAFWNRIEWNTRTLHCTALHCPKFNAFCLGSRLVQPHLS